MKYNDNNIYLVQSL